MLDVMFLGFLLKVVGEGFCDNRSCGARGCGSVKVVPRWILLLFDRDDQGCGGLKIVLSWIMLLVERDDWVYRSVKMSEDIK